MPPVHEVYAIRYASVEREVRDNFVLRDPHDGPMPMDFFVWLIRGPSGDIVVDSGFGAAAAARRQRQILLPVADGLAAMGVDLAKVADVIITHLHYDHAGNLDLFPAARFHLQDDEMAYATGRHMAQPMMQHAYEVEDVVTMLRRVYAGRVAFHQGTAEVAPGVTLHRIGGHTAGLQAVRVFTARGWVVLASDASHYYANMQRGNPFPIVFNVGEMLEGYATLRRLADSEAHIVPGHDPLVRRHYPKVTRPGVDAVALHLAPRSGAD